MNIDFDIFDKYIIAETSDTEKGIDPWAFNSETVKLAFNLVFGCSFDEAEKNNISEQDMVMGFFGFNEDINIFIMDNKELIENNSKYNEYREKQWGNDWGCWVLGSGDK